MAEVRVRELRLHREMMTPGAGPAGGEADDALLVRGVSHRFGSTLALDSVSLVVPRGAFVVLLGPNGAGKSTLVALVTRLYDNVSGEIRILGHDVRRRPAAALQQLGVVFQNRSLDGDLTVRQNLTYHAALHGIGRRAGRRLAIEALKRIDLLKCAEHKVRTLSGGQARRVEIARAILHAPSCLLLDEATAGLDVGSRESVLVLVRALAKEQGVGVLWATHLVDEVVADDTIVLLHKGRVHFCGLASELLEVANANSVRSAFLNVIGTQAEAT